MEDYPDENNYLTFSHFKKCHYYSESYFNRMSLLVQEIPRITQPVFKTKEFGKISEEYIYF